MKSGNGVYKFVNTEEEYDGNWENDLKNGFGHYLWSNGDKYSG